MNERFNANAEREAKGASREVLDDVENEAGEEEYEDMLRRVANDEPLTPEQQEILDRFRKLH